MYFCLNDFKFAKLLHLWHFLTLSNDQNPAKPRHRPFLQSLFLSSVNPMVGGSAADRSRLFFLAAGTNSFPSLFYYIRPKQMSRIFSAYYFSIFPSRSAAAAENYFLVVAWVIATPGLLLLEILFWETLVAGEEKILCSRLRFPPLNVSIGFLRGMHMHGWWT